MIQNLKPELSLVTEYKHCGSSTCQKVNPQPVSSFNKNKAHSGGLANYCKTCSREHSNRYSKANPKKMAEKARRLRQELKERDPKKAWAVRRNARLKESYGITLDQYYVMLRAQDHRCFICKRPEEEFPKKLVVDHCHATGAVRKLLCGLCNQMLGSAKENIRTLKSAIEYLEDHSGHK